VEASTRRPGRGVERLVLAGGLACAAALGGLALSPFGDPRRAGEAGLARLAGEVADGALAEWERMRRDGSLLGPEPVRVELPAPGADAPPPLAAVDVDPASEGRAGRDARHVVFDALLAESERLEHSGAGAGAALDAVLEALDAPADPPRRALGRLRAVQLAARAGRSDVARAQWDALRADRPGPDDPPPGALAQGGVACLLLAGLAAAPALAPDERRAAADLLSERWAAGALALPPVDLAPGAGSLRAALAERLLVLGEEGDAVRARLARAEARARAAALVALVGALPEPAALPADGAVLVLAGGGRELALARAPAPRGEAGGEAGSGEVAVAALARLLPVGEAGEAGEAGEVGEPARAWLARVREAGLLPAGFALDLGGDDASLGAALRPRAGVPGTPWTLVLRHADPASVVADEAAPWALLRAGLLALAVLIAAAGLFARRALVRERALADLRAGFVANVSHELRTPLASILLMAENLEQGRVPEQARGRYHALLRAEARRLRRLVDDVLDFSRLERGREPALAIEPLAVAELRDAIERDARELAGAGGARLTLAAAGPAPPEQLDGDLEALRRAALNLVDNARKHSGTPDIELSFEGDGAGGLVVAVRDRGRGVPRGVRERIFRPYERGERDRAPDRARARGRGARRRPARRRAGCALRAAPASFGR